MGHRQNRFFSIYTATKSLLHIIIVQINETIERYCISPSIVRSAYQTINLAGRWYNEGNNFRHNSN